MDPSSLARLTRSPIRWIGFAWAGAALVFGAACTGPQSDGGGNAAREELSEEMLRELIEQGTLRPVASMGPMPQPTERPRPYGVPPPQATPLEPTPDPSEGAAAEPPQPAPPRAEEAPRLAQAPFFNPWTEFGARITYDERSGLVTKPYPVRPGMGKRFFELVQEYGPFTFYDPANGPQGEGELDLVHLEGSDVEVITADLRGPLNVPGTPIVVAEWLVARAQPEVLREFEYFLNTFIGSPPQIEIEAKIVEVVARDSFDMGISNFLATLPEKALFNQIGFNLPNRSAGELLLEVGAIQDGTQYSALIELLATYENVSIISRPRSAVREGGRAKVEAVERIPFLQVASITAQGGFNTTLNYLEVGVRLFVTPRLVGSKVALEIDVEASQQTGDAPTVASAEGEIITTPILSTRQARTLVYLRPGEAVILGGLITERVVDQERKVPFLGDLPGVGRFFRSTFQSKSKAQVLFFIRPRVMQGAEMGYEF